MSEKQIECPINFSSSAYIRGVASRRGAHKGKDIDFKSCSSRVAADWVREPQGVCTSNQWTMYSFCTWYDKIDLTLYPYEKKICNLYWKLL